MNGVPCHDVGGNPKSLFKRNNAIALMINFLHQKVTCERKNSAPWRGARINDEVGEMLRRLLMRWFPKIVVAVPMVLALGACQSYHQFSPGLISATRFEADDAACRLRAQAEMDAIDQRAESASDDSVAVIIGSGLGAMIGAAGEGTSTYNHCMNSLGYKK